MIEITTMKQVTILCLRQQQSWLKFEFGCGGKPASKNRMHKELSDFAAHLREAMLSEGRVPRGPDCEHQSLNGGSWNSPLRDFNSIAVKLFALQFKHNAAYRKICEACSLTPEVVEQWTQIPAVPTAAFKELELSCIPLTERTAVFHSSGTTGQIPSQHFHNTESLAVYEASVWAWFERHMVPRGPGSGSSDLGLCILTPSPEQAPHSSLVHMFETVRQKLGGASVPAPAPPKRLRRREGASQSQFLGRVAADGTWTLDFDAVLVALNSSLITRHSSLLLGTAFSFVHLLDFLEEKDLRFDLPAGSRAMETGGYKNRSRAMPKTELHALITKRLGIPPENIICEYGMSELSSQAYDQVTSGMWHVTRNGIASCHASPVARHFRFPPWAWAQVVSPETGREVADGETGLIQIFDLANVFSVMAIQTEDLGVRHGEGFELIGRAQLAEPRGCSLMMDEPLAPAPPRTAGRGWPKVG